MGFENILLLLVVGFLGWKLFEAIGSEPKKDSQKQPFIVVKVIKNKDIANAFPVQQNAHFVSESDFLKGAKLAFHVVSNAFAKGQKKELKSLLAPWVYDEFSKQITERENKKNRLDFSLVCIDSAKIIEKTQDLKKVVVQFVSEQINILRDEQGNVLEGDPMLVATVKDTWEFKFTQKGEWIVYATKSEACPNE